ncbi:hypothetical protein [Pelobium manganitolerans]|uniref:hypothetical protein n=1 Tax=Pelobium manganitolerans TaxID=1842495 RepID=UPI003FA36102
MIGKSDFLAKGVIFIIIVIFLQFFSYTGISDDSKVLAAAIFGCGMLMMAMSIFTILFKSGYVFYPLDQMVFIFMAVVICSFFTAYIYWGQPLATSLLSYRLFYIYFLYFLLIFFDLSQKQVESLIQFIFFLTLIIFAIGYVTFPNPIFTMRSEERRNGITIFFDGQGFTFLGAFYYLQKYFKDFKLYHLILFAVGGAFLFFLTQARMMLAGVCLGAMLILLLSQLRYRYAYAIAGVCFAAIFYLTSGVFKGIKEQNAEQSEFASEDIRVQAYNFYLNDLQGGLPTLIFGNGYPAKGSKLETITYYGQDRGFYTSDIGLTGLFSFFGILGAGIWVMFFYRAFSMQNATNFNYVKAYFLMLFITAFTGYAIFDPGYMPSTVLALYLIRCNYKETMLVNRVGSFLRKQ